MNETDWTDRAGEVREGETLDAERLAGYLHEQLHIDGPVTVHQFPSGHSNLTYLVRAGERELILRRPPFGSRVKTAHDMGREYRILSQLHRVLPQAPRALVYCDDAAGASVLGAPFYVMERIVGVILRRRLPAGLVLDADTARRLSEAFIDQLAALHAVDYRAAGLGDLGKPEGYVERQVSGWTRRYQDARTDEIADVEWIAKWLAERIPPTSGAALVHGDFKYDNLVLDAADLTRVIGILDWEMATLGDPLVDLGVALGYWVEAGDNQILRQFAFGPTDRPGTWTRRELAERYAARTGRSLEHLVFYYCFALFKTAVVAQQIYYRYRQGLTKDPRFAALGEGVKVLARAAVVAAESGRI